MLSTVAFRRGRSEAGSERFENFRLASEQIECAISQARGPCCDVLSGPIAGGLELVWEPLIASIPLLCIFFFFFAFFLFAKIKKKRVGGGDESKPRCLVTQMREKGKESEKWVYRVGGFLLV